MVILSCAGVINGTTSIKLYIRGQCTHFSVSLMSKFYGLLKLKVEVLHLFIEQLRSYDERLLNKCHLNSNLDDRDKEQVFICKAS